MELSAQYSNAEQRNLLLLFQQFLQALALLFTQITVIVQIEHMLAGLVVYHEVIAGTPALVQIDTVVRISVRIGANQKLPISQTCYQASHVPIITKIIAHKLSQTVLVSGSSIGCFAPINTAMVATISPNPFKIQPRQ